MIRRINQIVLFAVIFCVNQQYLFGGDVGMGKISAADKLLKYYRDNTLCDPYGAARDYYFEQISYYDSLLADISASEDRATKLKEEIEIKMERYNLKFTMQKIANDVFMGDSDAYDRDVTYVWLSLEFADLHQYLDLGDNPKPASSYIEEARQYYLEKVRAPCSKIEGQPGVQQWLKEARVNTGGCGGKQIQRLKDNFAERFKGDAHCKYGKKQRLDFRS